MCAPPGPARSAARSLPSAPAPSPDAGLGHRQKTGPLPHGRRNPSSRRPRRLSRVRCPATPGRRLRPAPEEVSRLGRGATWCRGTPRAVPLLERSPAAGPRFLRPSARPRARLAHPKHARPPPAHPWVHPRPPRRTAHRRARRMCPRPQRQATSRTAFPCTFRANSAWTASSTSCQSPRSPTGAESLPVAMRPSRSVSSPLVGVMSP